MYGGNFHLEIFFTYINCNEIGRLSNHVLDRLGLSLSFTHAWISVLCFYWLPLWFTGCGTVNTYWISSKSATRSNWPSRATFRPLLLHHQMNPPTRYLVLISLYICFYYKKQCSHTHTCMHACMRCTCMHKFCFCNTCMHDFSARSPHMYVWIILMLLLMHA